MAAEKGAKGKTKAAAAEKIVKRELTKVLTVGTLVDGDLLTDEQAGHCVAIRVSGSSKLGLDGCS